MKIETKTIESILSDYLFGKKVKAWISDGEVYLHIVHNAKEIEGVITGVFYNKSTIDTRQRIRLTISHKEGNTIGYAKVRFSENIIFVVD